MESRQRQNFYGYKHTCEYDGYGFSSFYRPGEYQRKWRCTKFFEWSKNCWQGCGIYAVTIRLRHLPFRDGETRSCNQIIFLESLLQQSIFLFIVRRGSLLNHYMDVA